MISIWIVFYKGNLVEVSGRHVRPSLAVFLLEYLLWKKCPMEQCILIRFLTLKGLKSKDVQIELERMHKNETLEIWAIKHGDNVSCRVSRLWRWAIVRKTYQGWHLWRNHQDGQRVAIHFAIIIITASEHLQKYMSLDSPWKSEAQKFNVGCPGRNLTRTTKPNDSSSQRSYCKSSENANKTTLLDC
jgi:hypothetical protein